MLEKFINIFEGADHFYGQAKRINNPRSVKVEVNATTQKGIVTKELWQKHLDGVGSQLGIAPLKKDGTCKWGAIDIDKNNYDYQELLNKIRKLKLPLIMFRSKSGRAHVYMFMKNFHEAEEVKHVMKKLAAKIGVADILDRIYPMQTNMDNVEYGSWLNMPYFEGDTSVRYAFNPKGESLTPEDFLKFVEKRRVNHEQLIELAVPEVDELEDGPPCLKTLLKQGFPEGTRNNGLFNVGVYLKQASPDKWQTDIEEYNRKFVKPPLPAKEVLTLISTLEKKEYNYKCNDEPIRSYCDVQKCRTCKFGVGKGNTAPTFSSLAKLDTKPPLWFLSVDDKRVELTTEQLQNQTKFQRACMEVLNLMPPKTNERAWQAQIQTLMDNGMEIIEVSNDVSLDGQFQELLESFCNDLAQASTREEVLLGKPYSEEGNTYFRIKDLREYLVKHRFTELDTNKIASKLRDLKAEHTFWNLKGRGTNVWFIPEISYKQETLDGHDFTEDML